MTRDIRLMLSFRNHPKTKKLKFKLGGDSVLSLIWLLMFAAESKSDGKLTGMDETDIALAADWQGDPEEFTRTLFAVGFLDRDGETYRIHDWEENNPWAAGSKERSEHARKAAEGRWSKKYGSSTKNQQLKSNNDAKSMDEHCTEQEGAMQSARMSNAPSPYPSPTPLPNKNPLSSDDPMTGAGEDEKKKPPPCPHKEIIALYHKTLPELPRIVESTWADSENAKHLRTRWLSSPEYQNLNWWRDFFLCVKTNPHWMGENDRGWKANLRWLVNKTNFTKVLEWGANS